MRLWFLIAITGCGFQHGALTGDAAIVSGDGGDASADVRLDTMPTATCYARWLDNTIRFATPTAIAAVNTTGYERDPFLPADELTLYYSNGDIWMATRAAIGMPFDTPVEASAFNSTSIESKLSISADGKIAVVGSDRPGGAGSIDVWESIRTDVTAQWPAMNRMNVMMVETGGADHDPTLSADGNHLYIAPDNPGSQHIVMATRAGNGVFGATSSLTPLDSGTGDADPSPTPDERILVMSSNRSGSGDVYYATRASTGVPFGAPLPVPDINTPAAAEGDPHVSADGCRIYFVRNISGLDWDIFVAEAQ